VADAVQHLNPYRETALDYRKAGWLGTLPIPHKQKNPPPTGFTGHRAPYPDVEKITVWRNAKKRQNICVRVAGVDKEHEIIGIDVDHYQSGNKDKKGGDQLKALEAQFGKLPETWISSSRTDGFSGIRYYRVPRGLAFRGQVAKDIECISKGYRFAVVWPSIHPSGETYWWFPPGVVPDEKGRSHWQSSMHLPKASELPILPDSWLDYLTQHGMRADADVRIDIDSSVSEVYDWAYGLFHGDPDSDHMCRLYKNKVKKQIEDIKNEATSHDKIIKAHWNLIRLAAEGHTGWTQAIAEVDAAWTEDVIKRDKRSLTEVNGEVWRSRINALRKIKVQIEDRIKIGAAPVDICCETQGGICYTGINSDADGNTADGDEPPPDDPLDDIPRGPIVPVDDYLMNDDGNADHLATMYSTLKDGPAFRYADGYGWIVWHEGKGEEQPHWQLDSEGNQEMRRMFQRIRDLQTDYAETALKPAWQALQQQLDQQQANPNPQPNGITKVDVQIAKDKYYEWKRFALMNGNNRNATNAIEAAKSIPSVTVSVNELDRNPLLLGVANGVVELSLDDVNLRPARVDDLITLNTHTPYEPPSKLAQNTWEKYLDTFLPDLEHRRNVQIVLGHCLLGGNPEKRIIILKGQSETGKSTMLSAIQSALGDYAAPVNETMFQPGHFNEVLANALDKRVAVCSEFDSTTKLSASVVKRLTGGDTQTIPIKHSNATKEGEVQFVVVIATNLSPDIYPIDKALENRLLVLPFETVPQHIDRSLSNVVVEVCGTAVLWWLIEGYRQYRTIGQLPTSKLIEDKTKEMMSELDDVSMFLQEAIIKHDKFSKNIDWKKEPEWCIKRERLYTHYEGWCEINKIPESQKLTPNMLTRRLKALGVLDSGPVATSINGVGGRFWYGLKFKKLRRGGNVFPIRTQTEDDDGKSEK
jgi:P4 family phage/plasmid primase-like protien